MKYLKKILLVGVFLIVFYWGGSILKCEVLTLLHGDEFSIAYKDMTMLGEMDDWKVLQYSDPYARVYFVSKDRAGGDILSFTKSGDADWKYVSCDTVWSKTGSAEGYMWPYLR